MQCPESGPFLTTPPSTQDTKSHAIRRGFRRLDSVKERYIALIRVDKRDSFRRIAFLCTTPIRAPRASSGSDALNADAAAPLSPPLIAFSTDFTNVRTRVRHAPLIRRRRTLRLIRLTADLWFAIRVRSLRQLLDSWSGVL